MAKCWTDFCIAGDCDGVNHVDATGYTWSETKPAGVSSYHRKPPGIFSYHRSEVEKLKGKDDDGRYMLKITSSQGMTRWMSIDGSQLDRITEILAEKD